MTEQPLSPEAVVRAHALALTAHEAVSALADQRQLLAEPEVLNTAGFLLSLWLDDAGRLGLGQAALDLPALATVALDAVLAVERFRGQWNDGKGNRQ